MSRYDWKTPMRPLDDHEARNADNLGGQAAAIVHPDGRVQLIVMPDRGCFDSAVTISADDALALARTILDRLGPKRHPLEAPNLLGETTLLLIDAAENARQLYGGQEQASYVVGRELEAHSYRFELVWPDGGNTTFAVNSTAEHVFHALQRQRNDRNAAATVQLLDRAAEHPRDSVGRFEEEPEE